MDLFGPTHRALGRSLGRSLVPSWVDTPSIWLRSGVDLGVPPRPPLPRAGRQPTPTRSAPAPAPDVATMAAAARHRGRLAAVAVVAPALLALGVEGGRARTAPGSVAFAPPAGIEGCIWDVLGGVQDRPMLKTGVVGIEHEAIEVAMRPAPSGWPQAPQAHCAYVSGIGRQLNSSLMQELWRGDILVRE